jgi:hypothetical protein
VKKSEYSFETDCESGFIETFIHAQIEVGEPVVRPEKTLRVESFGVGDRTE